MDITVGILQQNSDDVGVSAVTGADQSCGSCLILSVNVCSVCQEESYRGRSTVSDRQVERCLTHLQGENRYVDEKDQRVKSDSHS